MLNNVYLTPEQQKIVERYNKTLGLATANTAEVANIIKTELVGESSTGPEEHIYSSVVTRVRNKNRLVWKGDHPVWELETFDIGDWASWSLKPHTTEEIRQRLISRPIEDTCISYICMKSQLEEDFFEEFMALSTGMFHETGNVELALTQPLEYNKENLAIVMHACQRYNMDTDAYVELARSYSKTQDYAAREHYKRTGYADRIDWRYICMYQSFSIAFWSKYMNKLKLYSTGAYTQKVRESLDNENEEMMRDDV